MAFTNKDNDRFSMEHFVLQIIIFLFQIDIMSFEPCSDIRFKLYAAQKEKADAAKDTTQIDDAARVQDDKENHRPAGLSSNTSILRGRGRGLLNLRQRLENRKKNNIREFNLLWLYCYSFFKKGMGPTVHSSRNINSHSVCFRRKSFYDFPSPRQWEIEL